MKDSALSKGGSPARAVDQLQSETSTPPLVRRRPVPTCPMDAPAQHVEARPGCRELEPARISGQTGDADYFDLVGINPMRWPEIRRRIAAVREYVALPRPNAADRDRIAAELGLSRSTFLNLVRIWRMSRSPAKLAGISAKKGQPRQTKSSLPVTSISEVQRAIDEMGTTTSNAVIIREVRERLRKRRLTQPSDQTLTNLIAKARAEDTKNPPFEPQLLVAECSIGLPVTFANQVVLARAILAVTVPERLVVGFDLSCDPDRPPTPEGLLRRMGVRSFGGLSDRPLVLMLGVDVDSRKRGTGQPPSSNRPTLAKLFGRELGGLKLIYRPSMARAPDKIAGSRQDSPVGPSDVLLALEHAIATNNASRAASAPEHR